MALRDKFNNFAVWYGQEGPELHAAYDGCRDYPCCGGKECGFSLESAREIIASWYEERAKFWREASDDEVLKQEFCL